MNEEEKKYPQLGIRVNVELLKELQEYAKKEQRSMSQVVRMALEDYLSPKGHSL